jgi:hypothetical protein
MTGRLPLGEALYVGESGWTVSYMDTVLSHIVRRAATKAGRDSYYGHAPAKSFELKRILDDISLQEPTEVRPYWHFLSIRFKHCQYSMQFHTIFIEVLITRSNQHIQYLTDNLVA